VIKIVIEGKNIQKIKKFKMILNFSSKFVRKMEEIIIVKKLIKDRKIWGISSLRISQ